MEELRIDNAVILEPLSSHRRGHWFEPITTHYLIDSQWGSGPTNSFGGALGP